MQESTEVKSSQKKPWRSTLTIYLQANSLRMLALGFSAGVPLLLVLGTLSFRLREAGIDRSTIGYLSWVGLAYGFKWVWSPLVDTLQLPYLGFRFGQRRSWLLISQTCIVTGLFGMGHFDPKTELMSLVLCAVFVAFASATQDIALDAYRIELGQTHEQAAWAACYQAGYRLGMIWAGAGVLWIAAYTELGGKNLLLHQASHSGWQAAYFVMAASMCIGVVTVLLAPKGIDLSPPQRRPLMQWLQEAVVAPFAEFWQRYRWHAILLLTLIGLYRVSDVVMGIMANPFYVDMGYTKLEVANVSKLYGVLMALLGAFIGGALAQRFGVLPMLMLGAVLSASSNLLFVWLNGRGHDLQGLIFVISADNLSSGLASAAFIAYLSSLTAIRYSATQYAMFSSLMLLLPKYLAGFSGDYVNAFGYASFFTATALMGIPVLVLVGMATRLVKKAPPTISQASSSLKPNLLD